MIVATFCRRIATESPRIRREGRLRQTVIVPFRAIWLNSAQPVNRREATMKNIRGKRALVTGAASGIGREIALTLALEGTHVYLLDVDGERLNETVREAQRCGVEAVGVTCDLLKPPQLTAALSAMLDAWGAIDILVNNAGVAY